MFGKVSRMMLKHREIDRESVIALFKHEDKLRKSDRYQARYDEVTAITGTNRTENVENEIQYEVLETFGYDRTLENLTEYRLIPNLYRHDKEVVDSVLFMKYNIMKDPVLKPGQAIPDMTVYDMEGRPCSLLEFCGDTTEKPLLLIGGSLTWPPHRLSTDSYKEFYSKYRDQVDLKLVYVLEAHFVEETIDEDGNKDLLGWPIGNHFRYPQHKSLEDRLAMGRKFLNKYNIEIPMVCDNMDNEFNKTFGIWPDRAILIFQGKMAWFSVLEEGGARHNTWTEQIEELLDLNF